MNKLKVLDDKIREYIEERKMYPTRIYLDVNSFNVIWEQAAIDVDVITVVKNGRPRYKGLPIYIVMDNLNLFVVSQYKFTPEHIEVS